MGKFRGHGCYAQVGSSQSLASLAGAGGRVSTFPSTKGGSLRNPPGPSSPGPVTAREGLGPASFPAATQPYPFPSLLQAGSCPLPTAESIKGLGAPVPAVLTWA